MKLYWDDISKLEIAWISAILIVATLGSLIGGYLTVVGFWNFVHHPLDTDNQTPISDTVLEIVVVIALVLGIVGTAFGIWAISKSHKKPKENVQINSMIR